MKGEILHGRDLDRLEESCDVVIVGSGAGGAVMAAHLVEAGLSVIVLEEGPHYTQEEIRAFRPTQAMRSMWREGGLLVALGVGKTPLIGVAVGRNVGGSSVHTGGVCFRVPSHVHGDWVSQHGLPGLSERAFEDAYTDVERRVHVTEVPVAARSGSTAKFVEGATKLGIPTHPTRRNTVACEGNGLCNFGCPKGAKMSVDISYLPDAIERGALLVSDALVSRVLFEGDRAVGVEGTLTAPPPYRGTPTTKFRIRARAVVSACGTLHTPLLLGASGVRNPHLGRHLTLHPSLRVAALFDDRVDGWSGAMQSVYSEHFQSDGITLVGIYPSVNLLVAGLPGVGPSHRAVARKLSHIGIHGALIHDEGGGRVRRSPLGREGIVTYEMASRDLARLRRSLTILSEIAFAAGAREVMVPIFGVPPLRDMDAVRRLETAPLDPRRIECMSFHPLGSARMARSAAEGVTAENGSVFGTRGLFVADGSVLPTSIGVNSQISIMAMATRLAWQLREQLAPGFVALPRDPGR